MELLLESSMRAVLVAAGVALSLKAFHVTSARAAHRMWTAVLLVMLTLPVLVAWGPPVTLRVLPQSLDAWSTTESPSRGRTAASAGDSLARVAPAESRRPTAEWSDVVAGVYLLGLFGFLIRLAAAVRDARTLVRGARVINGRLTHGACITPVTVGLLAPIVVLPRDWVEWPQQKLGAVMAHEQEHVRRLDPFVTWLALLNRAVFWFHPLAWWLPRKLSTLAEQACDAAVLSRGHDAETYAACLIEFAKSVARAGRRLSPLETTMPGSHLAQRIQRIRAGGHLQQLSRVRLTCATLACVTFVGVAAAVTPVSTQVGVPAPSRFPGPDEAFEVASVKPNQSGQQQWFFDDPPGGIVGTNVVLRDLIRFAYFIYGGDWDIRIAGPDWIKTARFDIDVKGQGEASQAQKMSMLRRLLAERFALKVHYEHRERPIYALVLARPDRRLGPQLAPASIDCAAVSAAMQAARAAGAPPPYRPDASKRPVCGARSAAGQLSIGGLTMQQFALHITSHAGRPVTDKTGLTGQFDLDLRWTPGQPSLDGNAAPVPAGPSIFTALEEQLGLRLEAQRGPVEVLVIDSIEQPTPN